MWSCTCDSFGKISEERGKKEKYEKISFHFVKQDFSLLFRFKSKFRGLLKKRRHI
jgi:hypothetical protein